MGTAIAVGLAAAGASIVDRLKLRRPRWQVRLAPRPCLASDRLLTFASVERTREYLSSARSNTVIYTCFTISHAIPVRRWESHCSTKAFKRCQFPVNSVDCTNKIYQQSRQRTDLERG
jgi:hypothetical protein